MVVVSLRKLPGTGFSWREEAARTRRPSLPVIPQYSELAMSSVGHRRSSRPTLYEWHAFEQNNRYPGGETDGGPVNYCIACFPDGQEISLLIDPAMRLYELFEEPLRTRGMSVNDVALFLEGSHTPVPENAESRYLAGQRILVRGRGAMRMGRHSRTAVSMDDSPGDRPSRKMSAEAVSRKSSFANSRMMSKTSRQHSENKLFGSDEADGKSNDSSLRDVSILDDASTSAEPYDDGGTRRARSVASSRISLFSFGKDKNEVVARLEEMKASSQLSDYRDLEIESSWKDIVQQELSQRLCKQQEALWEIVTKEKNYIDVLKHMAELKYYLNELKRDGYLKDIDIDIVFRNYDELFKWHYRGFWQGKIMKMLGLSRSTGQPLEISLLEEWFIESHTWSRYYVHSTDKHQESLVYLQKKRKDNHIFAEFVMWAESQQAMQRQKLSDMLARPMQQITRYRLLLESVLRESQDQEERKKIQEMIEGVSRATHQLNFEMNNNDLQRQLLDIQGQIDGYDCIDQDEFERLTQRRCLLNLVEPMRFPPPFDGPPYLYRRLFFRGDLKMRESKQGPKTDVYCYVFTDMFLICRKKGDKMRVARPPIHMSQCLFHQANETSFYVLHMNTFGTCSQFYIMQAGNKEDMCKWLDQLHMAFEECARISVQRMQLYRPYDSPMDELAAPDWTAGGRFRQYIPVGPVVHRKSSSMDSQCMAAHAHMNHMHRVHTVSSTEQLDRVALDSPGRLLPRHKLSVASCSANVLSSSKSSVDLHLAETHAGLQRTRSRSNSSGPEIAGNKRQSRSPSPRSNEDHPTMMPNGFETNNVAGPMAEEEQPASHGRRFEKRYHTADGFELKPRGTQSILKRFSLNVNGGSSRKISARLGEHSRRNSQASTAASTDSFGSSTSGISSASDGLEPAAKCHVTSVAVNESPSESTLNISLDELDLNSSPEKEEKTSPPAPPLPEIPPPESTTLPDKELPELPPLPKEESNRQELLKFILDSKLETSDV